MHKPLCGLQYHCTNIMMNCSLRPLFFLPLLFRKETLLMWIEVSCLMTSLLADLGLKMSLYLHYEWANLFLTAKEENSIVCMAAVMLWHFKVAIVVTQALMIQRLEIECWVILRCYSCTWVQPRYKFLLSFVRIREKVHLTQEWCSGASDSPQLY